MEAVMVYEKGEFMSMLKLWRWFCGSDFPPKSSDPLSGQDRDALKTRTLDGVAKVANERKWGARLPAVLARKQYESAKKEVMTTLRSRKEKEDYIAKFLKCPNCGALEFDEVGSNAALTLRCDCGLTFNFMPQLRHVDIVRDPMEI